MAERANGFHHVPEREISDAEKKPFVSKLWWAFSRLCTIFIPDIYLSSSFSLLTLCGKKKEDVNALESEEEQQAWREKWTLCFVMFLFSAVFVGLGGLLPLLLCEDVDHCTMENGSARCTVEFSACDMMNVAMYGVMLGVTTILVIQCACSFVYVIRSKLAKRTITRDVTGSKVIVMVPCYSEDEAELRRTIDSVHNTTYPDDNKVLIVVADGNFNFTDVGEVRSTPQCLARILGFQLDTDEVGTFDCSSFGERTGNRAKLYIGTKNDRGRALKYIVIVKCGTEAEKRTAQKPGNRGKRDSQLLVTGLFNRVHHGRRLNPLENAIRISLVYLDIPLENINYLMAIDADTEVDSESINQMVFSMSQDDDVIALCGETQIENQRVSLITRIQVFEYYTNHMLKKTFESYFDCVSCLPGCFAMYRLLDEHRRPILANDDVFQRYAKNNITTLHDKNLFHLGEDRLLTTLLLKYFPGKKLSFVPEATCKTVVPETYSVLLSQRRRWVNSTFHNLFELLLSKNLTTFCCISMKVIVAMDIIAGLILPASLLFVLVNVYLTVVNGNDVSIAVLIAIAISFGVQVVVFVVRLDLQHIWWFPIYMFFGVPIFHFVIPIYSFWNMDDFSWGATVNNDAAPPEHATDRNPNGAVSNV